jgi:ATP synthase protein I
LFVTALIGLRIALAQGQDPQRMVRVFYRAMALKFVLAVIVFVIVAKWFAGYFAPVLTGYFVSLTAYWLAMRRMVA